MREKSWEYAGRTVEEATETALEELGLERDDIFVEILEEPQKGFLGIGGKEARIRVELIGEWEVMGKKDEPRKPEMSTKPAPEADEEDETEEEERGPSRPAPEAPEKMVRETLELLDIDATVESKEGEDSIVVDVWGDDVAILIGKGGATLDALQYLVNISCRRREEVGKRIIIDVEGYRKRRKAKIEKQADQSARKAMAEGRSVELPPMSASERKIVHMALRKMHDVKTESEGEEPDRRVVIVPVTNRVSRETSNQEREY
jgi:spoIIIJ-associated protein